MDVIDEIRYNLQGVVNDKIEFFEGHINELIECLKMLDNAKTMGDVLFMREDIELRGIDTGTYELNRLFKENELLLGSWPPTSSQNWRSPSLKGSG